MPQIADPKQPIGGADTKVDAIFNHCLYMIATGKWAEGDQLPSVRSAERK